MENAIVRLFGDSGVSIREFADRAGLKYSTAHDIVTGKAKMENIGAGAFVRIAGVLNTTADALMSGVDDSDDMEAELLALFRSMDENGRERLIEQAYFLASRHQDGAR